MQGSRYGGGTLHRSERPKREKSVEKCSTSGFREREADDGKNCPADMETRPVVSGEMDVKTRARVCVCVTVCLTVCLCARFGSAVGGGIN